MSHDYREYQRSSRPFQPGTEYDDRRGLYIPVGRGSSGKKSGYMQWLCTEGRTRFFNTYGMRYDDKNPSDKEKMTVLYKSIPPEQKAALKEWQQNQNSNRHAYLDRRRKINYERRKTQHDNINRHRELELAHAENLRNQKEVNIETTNTKSDFKQIHVYEDLVAHIRSTSDRAKVILKSIMLTKGLRDESPLWHPHLTMQFISMSPLINSYKMHLNKMSVYPAEVSITTLHLKTGLLETESRFIYYDAEWYHQEPEDQETANNRKSYSEMIGIPETGVPRENALTPDEALMWLRTRLDSCPTKRLLCDKNAFNFVFYGLTTLAKYMGHNATNYFKLRLMDMVAIQDFTETILDVAPLLIPKDQRWGKEAIKQAFEFYDLVPCTDQNRVCPTHAEMDSVCKMNCTGAHSARILQNFFYILRQNKVADIYDYCDSPAHRPCQVTEPNGLREACFIARTITREEEIQIINDLRKEREARQQQQPYIAGEISAEPIQYQGQETDSENEEYEDYQNFYEENYPEQPDPRPAFNPHVIRNNRGFGANDNFFSASRTDPEHLTQRAGVRDMTTSLSAPVPVAPENVVPHSETGSAITKFSRGTYQPYGIMPEEQHFVKPGIDVILHPNESKKYFDKLAKKKKIYKPIVLTCLSS